jgi:hypothetical protein
VVRQAHTYLVGAVSGATLIVVAIAVFVLLVSAQVFRDWPLAALGDSGGGSAAVSDARPAAVDAAAGASTNAGSGTNAVPAGAAANGGAGGERRAGNEASGGSSLAPAATTPTDPAAGGAEAGDGGRSPTTSTPAAGSTPTGSSGGGGSSSASSGGNSGGSGSAATTPSGKVAETVNNTVGTVDETVTGGALEKTGVTGVTEGVVNGVVGPESTVGKVVDESIGALEGLLHPHH